MDNQTNYNVETKYNPLKDANFWVAFVLGGGPILFMLIGNGSAFESPVIINLVFLFAWTGWIIFKKGKKGSLLVGFIIAIIAAGISFYPVMKIDEAKREKEINQAMEKYRQQMQIDLDKTKQQGR